MHDININKKNYTDIFIENKFNDLTVTQGTPSLGANVDDFGTNFGIYIKSGELKEVSLCIFESPEDETPIFEYKLSESINNTGEIWHLFIGEIYEGTFYLWKIDDSYIIDPYCLSMTNNKNYSDRKSIVIGRPRILNKHIETVDNDIIIYEAHIKLFTRNKNSNTKNPGTFSAFIEKIPYLVKLGVTAVEFLPIYEWDDYIDRYGLEKNKILTNIWGYNPINFFATTNKFSTNKELGSYSEIEEFKLLVNKLHENGIEVYLDVVYNHTAEGGNGGKIYNFKKTGNSVYYMLEDNEQNYINYSGCGNTFSCNHIVSKKMVMESLIYWYLEVGVDGFRFDLAPVLGRDMNGQWLSQSILHDIPEHPLLSNAKFISESWDLGGYYVGAMPSGWYEWNGRYRDTVRQFIRGDFGQITELVKRIFGSVDIFHSNKRGFQSSINFICCHDGFTMWDLVSYNEKYNYENGENNLDGENNNLSYNHGEEGNTTNIEVLELRLKQIKNMMMILFISQGIPMLHMGDEMGKTQFGNNNAYCQDNALNWIDWKRSKKFKELTIFTENMIKLRKKFSIFRKKRFIDSSKELIIHGTKLLEPDFSYYSLSIAFELLDLETGVKFYIALNSYVDNLEFELPKDENEWFMLLDTSKKENENFKQVLNKIESEYYTVNSKSSIILMSKNSFI